MTVKASALTIGIKSFQKWGFWQKRWQKQLAVYKNVVHKLHSTRFALNFLASVEFWICCWKVWNSSWIHSQQDMRGTMYSKYESVFLGLLPALLYLPVILITSDEEHSYIYLSLIWGVIQYLECSCFLVCCALLASSSCSEVSHWLLLVFHCWWPLQTGRLSAN